EPRKWYDRVRLVTNETDVTKKLEIKRAGDSRLSAPPAEISIEIPVTPDTPVTLPALDKVEGWYEAALRAIDSLHAWTEDCPVKGCFMHDEEWILPALKLREGKAWPWEPRSLRRADDSEMAERLLRAFPEGLPDAPMKCEHPEALKGM